MNAFKKRFGAKSTFQFVVIMVVFSLAGTSILFVKKPIFNFVHITDQTSLWLKIPFVICMYYVLLLFWGTVCGQFRYFWEKEKRMVRFLFRPLLPRPTPEPDVSK